MNIFRWDPKLELDVPLIDNQHKQFLQQVNIFFIKEKFDQSKRTCKEQLNFIEQYLLYHPQAEEVYQIQSKYPKYREHQASHDALKIKTKSITMLLEKENFSKDAQEKFRRYIVELVEDHMFTEDIEFAKYYKTWVEGKVYDLAPVVVQEILPEILPNIIAEKLSEVLPEIKIE